MKVDRKQSIRYVGDDDAPILRFGSLDRGGEEEDDYHKNSNLFMYNSEEDVYRLNSLKRSRLPDSSKNLEIFKEEEEKKALNKNLNTSEEDDDITGGNVIFANSKNINFKEKKLTPLYIIMLCYLAFCLIELVCGYYSNSITLMADAAHYFSESSCFVIYIVSIYVSRTKATNNMSFGFHRGEMIGVLVRATFLFGLSFWLLYYVAYNIINPKIVDGFVIIILGIISTFFNLIMGLVLLFVGISNGITFSEKELVCNHQHENNGLNCHSVQRTFTNVIIKSIQSCLIIHITILWISDIL